MELEKSSIVLGKSCTVARDIALRLPSLRRLQLQLADKRFTTLQPWSTVYVTRATYSGRVAGYPDELRKTRAHICTNFCQMVSVESPGMKRAAWKRVLRSKKWSTCFPCIYIMPITTSLLKTIPSCGTATYTARVWQKDTHILFLAPEPSRA